MLPHKLLEQLVLHGTRVSSLLLRFTVAVYYKDWVVGNLMPRHVRQAWVSLPAARLDIAGIIVAAGQSTLMFDISFVRLFAPLNTIWVIGWRM